MATPRRCGFTGQGFGTLEPAARQGKQAGPQASSSYDRSSLLVGNLATGELLVTRNVLHVDADHTCDDRKRNNFCFICSQYEVPRNRRRINQKIKDQYSNLFNIQIKNEDFICAPEYICCLCSKMLRNYENTMCKPKMTVPTLWKIPNSQEDCYFCNTNVSGINNKNKSKIVYANVTSITRPVYITKTNIEMGMMEASTSTERMEIDDNDDEQKEKSVEMDDELEDDESESFSIDDDSNSASDDDYISPDDKINSGTISQEKVNDLVRDLGLPKNGSEYLAAWLKENTTECKNIKSSYYRNRDKEFRGYFSFDEKLSLVYCHDVSGLINHLKELCYESQDWRLFIDSSKRSLKAVLLHNTNVYAAVPVGHSTSMKEEYRSMKDLLSKIKYDEHRWQICGDLKIITIILGQQTGFTKTPCFLCEWDSRDRVNHYVKKIWPPRLTFKPGIKNIINEPLVNPSKVLLPPLHIKLGLMKQWVKALNKDGDCFKYLGEQFPQLSDAKLKEGIFDGPQIRKMLRDPIFIQKMNAIEKKSWVCFKDVVENFLGNRKSENYKEIVTNLIDSFKKLGCLMNLKLHFLHSHLDYFPENLGDYSEEQGERFHQDIKEMERRYQGRWDVNMMADYCWNLKRDLPSDAKKRKRNPLRRSFADKTVRHKKCT